MRHLLMDNDDEPAARRRHIHRAIAIYRALLAGGVVERLSAPDEEGRWVRLTVETLEAAGIPHWLKQMDFTYVERPVFTKGWRSKDGLMPSDYWKRNMFVEFMEDDIGIKLRDYIVNEILIGVLAD